MSDIEKFFKRLEAYDVDSETLAIARKELSLHSHKDENWLYLAAHLRKLGQFDASLETYETAARRFPNSARLWSNRGILLCEYGHLSKAIASFGKALELQPNYVHAIVSMAIAYEKLQDFTTASHFYRQALSLDEGRTICWNNLGNCLRMQGLRREAQECYNKALKKDPQYIDAMFNLASIQYELKDYTAALRTVERCAELDPSDPAIQALSKEIQKKPDVPIRAVPQPLHNSSYIFRASTNIDEHGNIIEPDYSSKEILSSDDILAMSREDAARVVGFRAWDRLHLQRLIHEALPENEPPPQALPTPFVSYRWGDPEHSKWVSRFVQELEDRGYDVVFDRNAEKEDRPPTAPELIARMVKCNLLLAMLTDQYTRRVLVSPEASSPVDDGWVFDEWDIAKHLGNMQRLRFVGIWVSGDDLPPPFTRENVCDFRDPERYYEEMDKTFPVRYVTVIGFRPDKTSRAITHVKRSERKKIVSKLQALQEFEYITVVEEPANRSDKANG